MDGFTCGVRLSDGRTLAYSQFGKKDGQAVIYFHGGGSSRKEGALYREAAKNCGIRLICVDRPGIGLSDFKRDRKLLQCPQDIEQLADSLKIDKFCVVGFSGGAPYALTCIYAMPERVTACAIISGMVPDTLAGAGTPLRFRSTYWAKHLSFLYKPAMLMLYPLLRSPNRVEWMLRNFSHTLSPADNRQLQDAQVRAILAESIAEGARQGGLAAFPEILINTGTWGYRLSDVQASNVQLWHGESDTVVPGSVARAMSREILNCRATFVAGEGHLSLPINYCEQIFRTLTSSG